MSDSDVPHHRCRGALDSCVHLSKPGQQELCPECQGDEAAWRMQRPASQRRSRQQQPCHPSLPPTHPCREPHVMQGRLGNASRSNSARLGWSNPDNVILGIGDQELAIRTLRSPNATEPERSPVSCRESINMLEHNLEQLQAKDPQQPLQSWERHQKDIQCSREALAWRDYFRAARPCPHQPGLGPGSKIMQG